MGNIDISVLRILNNFFLLFCLSSCSIHPSLSGRFPVNLDCQKIDYLISASQLKVKPSKEGFVLISPLIYGKKILLPTGTIFHAQRVFPQALPPRYAVDALRLNAKSPFVPATGVVFYSEGEYWLTLSNLYLPKKS
ncbi:hypothetical protein [Methylacidiphilum caldifontis]|nr:hypothetical protein [Methylacidiphilum caldifontis]